MDGALDGAGADDEAGTLGATDGAREGATDGIGGTGVGDEVHAARAVNRDSDNVMVAMARFIWNLQEHVGQRIGSLG